MAQKQIDLGLKYLKSLKRKNIEEERKERVKRQLFTDERPVSPGPVQRDDTPLSYDISSDGSPTIFFIGYKFPQDTGYKCEECFTSNIDFAFRVELEIYVHSNRCYGERNYLEYKRDGFSESDPSNYCVTCRKPLYVIRPYHSSHLDFA